MDASITGAELALHIARFVQMPVGSAEWPEHWEFVLRGGRYSRTEAAEVLARSPKPVLVAPLLEPGMLALWPADALDEEGRSRFDHDFANQVEAVAGRIRDLELTDSSRILFVTAAGRVVLSAAECRACFRAYAVLAGWNLVKGPDGDHPASLVIRRSDGQWSPGGPSRPGGSGT